MIDEKEVKEFCELMGWKYITFISEDEFCVVRRNASLFFVTPDELSRLLALHAVAKAAHRVAISAPAWQAAACSFMDRPRPENSQELIAAENEWADDSNRMALTLARLAEVGGGK